MFGSIGAPEVIVLSIIVAIVYAVFGRRAKQPDAPEQGAARVPIEATATGTRRCPFCAEDIQAAAIVCKHCHADLQKNQPATTTVYVEPRATPSAGVAAVLSLVIPGAGQMYRGRIGAGLVWLVCVVIGYMLFIFPGLILHLLCIVSAASG